MSKVEELYDKNLIRLRTCCSVFNDLENKCSAKKCVCQSIAECLAYQDTVLPNGYSKADILNFNGHVNGKRTLDNHSVATSVCKILEFCFGDFKVNDSSTRYDLHKNSKMDTRFSNGTNLIINPHIMLDVEALTLPYDLFKKNCFEGNDEYTPYLSS